eukprot:6338045-Amphidinium_carterae.1
MDTMRLRCEDLRLETLPTSKLSALCGVSSAFPSYSAYLWSLYRRRALRALELISLRSGNLRLELAMFCFAKWASDAVVRAALRQQRDANIRTFARVRTVEMSWLLRHCFAHWSHAATCRVKDKVRESTCAVLLQATCRARCTSRLLSVFRSWRVWCQTVHRKPLHAALELLFARNLHALLLSCVHAWSRVLSRSAAEEMTRHQALTLLSEARAEAVTWQADPSWLEAFEFEVEDAFR